MSKPILPGFCTQVVTYRDAVVKARFPHFCNDVCIGSAIDVSFSSLSLYGPTQQNIFSRIPHQIHDIDIFVFSRNVLSHFQADHQVEWVYGIQLIGQIGALAIEAVRKESGRQLLYERISVIPLDIVSNFTKQGYVPARSTTKISDTANLQ